jgi:hypothetical protein
VFYKGKVVSGNTNVKDTISFGLNFSLRHTVYTLRKYADAG